MNCTDGFAGSMIQIYRKELYEERIHAIKRCLLDYYAVTFAGAKQISSKMEPFLKRKSEGRCTIFCDMEKADIHTAAIVNGFSSHVLELDDGHRYGMLHPGATIISAMVAVAQQENLPFCSFAKGINAGYEAAVRLASAIQPSHKLKGFHATGTCGTIGVAVAIGLALGYDEMQLKSVISLACTSAAGLLVAIDDESQIKPYNIANSVSAGINAAYMGSCSFNGPYDALGGKRGFIRVFSDNIDAAKLTEKSIIPAIRQIYVKPYAACRHCHSPIECALQISSTDGFKAEDVAGIEVLTYRLAIDGHNEKTVRDISSAKMSIPYCVAVSLCLGSCGMEAFSEELTGNPTVTRLASMVEVKELDELTAAFPNKRGSIVTVKMNDGTSYTKRVDYPLGEPENYISDEGLNEKYDSLMEHSGVDKERSEQIKRWIWNLEQDYDSLISM